MLCVCSNNGCVLYNGLAGLAVLDIQGRLKNSFQTAFPIFQPIQIKRKHPVDAETATPFCGTVAE